MLALKMNYSDKTNMMKLKYSVPHRLLLFGRYLMIEGRRLVSKSFVFEIYFFTALKKCDDSSVLAQSRHKHYKPETFQKY